MCVALALGYDRIRQNSVEDELKGDKLVQDLWDILTQYSKIVLKEVCGLLFNYGELVYTLSDYF